MTLVLGIFKSHPKSIKDPSGIVIILNDQIQDLCAKLLLVFVKIIGTHFLILCLLIFGIQ